MMQQYFMVILQKKCSCYDNCKTAVYIDELDNKDVISGINNFEMELKSDKN